MCQPPLLLFHHTLRNVKSSPEAKQMQTPCFCISYTVSWK
jgi:hypothetical protein